MIPTLSQEEIEISSADAEAFQADFESLKPHLFAVGQDFNGLLHVLSEFLQGHTDWFRRVLGQSTMLLSTFQQ